MNSKRPEPELPQKSKAKSNGIITTTATTSSSASPQISGTEGQKQTKSLENQSTVGKGKEVVIKIDVPANEDENRPIKSQKDTKDQKKKFRVPLLIGTIQRKYKIQIIDHNVEFDASSRSTTSESKELSEKWYGRKPLDTTEEKVAVEQLKTKIKKKRNSRDPSPVRLASNVVQGNETNSELLFPEPEHHLADVELDDHHHIIFLKKLETEELKENLKKLNDTPTPPKPEYFGVLEIHGLRAWCRADCLTMQMLMTVILLTFIGFLFFFTYFSLHSYFTNPFMTIYNAKFRSSLHFPNVYICPTNFVNKSKMKRKIVKDREEWLKIYNKLQSKVFKTSLIGNTNSLWDVITFIITSVDSTINVEKYHYRQTDEAKLRKVYDYIMKVGFDLKEFFRECAFGVDRIECSEIIEAKLDRNYGKCFSVNVANIKQKQTTMGTSGLRLFIDIHSELGKEISNANF